MTQKKLEPQFVAQQLTPGNLATFRIRYKVTAATMAAILGLKTPVTWRRWESGTTPVPLWLTWALRPIAERLLKMEQITNGEEVEK